MESFKIEKLVFLVLFKLSALKYGIMIESV